MSKYDQLFDFRIAMIKDIDDIMLFIKEEWNENHILANDKEFFIWMYGNDNSEEINFVLMTDKSNNIKGINGFVSYSNNKERLFVSSALTKVSNSVTVPMTGIELIKRFHSIINAKAYYSYGTNPKTMAPIGQKVFRFDVGYMDHYYRLNDCFGDYHIAVINEKQILPIKENKWSLVKIQSEVDLESFDFEKEYENQAYKSKAFIIKRYLLHPVYQYEIFLIKNSKMKDSGVLITREIEVNDRKILRIVDYLGDINEIRYIGNSLNEIMHKNSYEYIDFYEKGIPDVIMKSIGFVSNSGENVIPNYFEPFVQENIKLMYQRSNPNIVIFKADGDQDRPNFR